MTRQLAALFLAFVALVGMPTHAAQPDRQAELLRDFRALQALDARVHAIGWRLRTGNAPWCSELAADSGLLLQDIRAYARADALRSALELDGDIFVQATAPGSSAAIADIAPLSVVESLGETAMSFLAWSDSEPWSRLVAVDRLLSATTTENSSLALLLAGRSDAITLDTRPACLTKFEIVSGGDSLGADGQRVRVGRDFPGLAYPEDELAAALAHELAHNILRHPQWLAAEGRKRRDVRASEREADRMMPWLLANAGYPPEAAVRFMRRWGPQHDGGLFRKRTHDGWDERVELIASELPAIADAIDDAGTVDWRKRFAPRDIR